MESEVDRARGKFQADSEKHRSMLTTDSSKRLSSVDEQIDSGLGSIGYCSLQSDEHHSISSDPSEAKESREYAKENTNVSANPLASLESSISGLRISTCPSKTGDQCDSGLDEHNQVESITKDDVGHWISPHFSPQQIMDIFKGDEDGDNHLHLSIIHGLPEVTMQIIGLAPHWEWLNQPNNLLQTALHIAVITRQNHVVRRLICAGALVDVRDQMGNTPLHNACRLGYEDIVRTLLCPVDHKECFQNLYDIPFQRLPQDLESMNYEGLTCLHLAAIGGHLDVMRLLLESGASVNAAEGKSGRTVLHLAADWGNLDMIKFLLSRQETDINARTYAGLTPFLLALGRQNTDVVNELVVKGAMCETLSLSEESDSDISDEEMTDDSFSNGRFGVSSQRGHPQSYRDIQLQSY